MSVASSMNLGIYDPLGLNQGMTGNPIVDPRLTMVPSILSYAGFAASIASVTEVAMEEATPRAASQASVRSLHTDVRGYDCWSAKMLPSNQPSHHFRPLTHTRYMFA